MNDSRRLLQHFLAAIAYRSQKALRGVPGSFGDFRVGRPLAKFRSLYQKLPPYQQREGIRLVVANVRISEEALEISIHGRPASEEVLEKLRAPGIHAPRRSERSTWLRSWSAKRTPFSVLKMEIQLVLGLEPRLNE